MAQDVDVPIALERSARIGLPLQIVTGIREHIAAGRLRPGDRMPSTRVLAAQLGVARGTVQTAYEHLIAEGQLTAADRSGTLVNPELHAPHSEPGQPAERDAAAGRGTAGHSTAGRGTAGRDPADRPPATGPAAARSASARPVSSRLGDGPDLRADADFRAAWRRSLDIPLAADDGTGTLPARRAIAEHLRLVRGMRVRAADILLTTGARDGLRTVLDVLVPAVLGVEEPGFPGLRRVLRMTETTALPVDGDGIDPAGIPAGVPALLLTPNHLYPDGASMTAARRVALLAWAERTGGWLLEDDYDTDLRYTGALPPTLIDLDTTGRVIHLGSFASVLGSGLGIGYLIATGPIGAALAAHRRSLGAPSALLQTALTEYLETGGLRRRMLRIRRRMATAAEVMAGSPLDWQLGGVRATLELPAAEVPGVMRALQAAGVQCAELADRWTSSGVSGVEIAPAELDDRQLVRALRAVEAVVLTGQRPER